MVQILYYAGTFTENNTTLWCWADEEEYSTGRVSTNLFDDPLPDTYIL